METEKLDLFCQYSHWYFSMFCDVVGGYPPKYIIMDGLHLRNTPKHLTIVLYVHAENLPFNIDA